MPGPNTAIAPPLEALTEREAEVLALVARGKTNGEIASELGITFNTAKTHVAHILAKLGVETREEAAAWHRTHPEPAPTRRQPQRQRQRWNWLALPLAFKIGAAAVTAVAVGGVAAAGVILLANQDGDEEPADDTPSETADLRPSPSAESPATPTPDAALACPDDGNVLHLEPVFCVRWADRFDDESGYSIMLRYGGNPSTETFAFVAPPDAESFVFPLINAPYSGTDSLEQCLSRASVTVQITAERPLPLNSISVNSVDTMLECTEDAQGGYSTRLNRAPADPLVVEARPFAVGDPAPFDWGYAYFIATGCWGCEGPTSTIERMYVDSGGELRRDTILSGEQLGTTGYILGYDHSPDLATWVAIICATGYCGAFGQPTDDASVTIYRSTDAAVTWQAVDALDGVFFLYDILDDGSLLLDHYILSSGANEWLIWRGGTLTPAPPEIVPSFDANGPVTLDDGTVLARSGDGTALVSANGSLRLPLPSTRGTIWDVERLPGTERRFLVHYDEGHVPVQTLVIYDGSTPIATFSLDGLNAIVFGWLDDHRLIGDLATYWPDDEVSGNFPVIFDIERGTIHYIDGPFVGLTPDVEPGQLGGRNYFFAALPGPFARVATGDPECLNIRAEPSASAAVVACHFDGVLLRTTGETTAADGRTWLAVTTPGGRPGWAASEFLER